MLNENQVVDAVAGHLQDDGWRIVSTSSTSERGHDVLAARGETTLAVEAKGETSSDPHSRRYREAFSSSQKHDHVAKAFYKAACVLSAGQHRAGIAVPSDERHRELIEGIGPVLKVLGVAIFFVDDDRTVREWPHQTRGGARR